MRAPVLLLLCLLLPSCAGVSYFGVGAEPSPAPGTTVNWPGRPFHEIRAYCYDYTAADHSEFLFRGRMHPGVMDPEGVVLDAGQSQRFIAAVTTSHDTQARTPCYKPHHAFVAYDEGGSVVAVFEMCFGCNQFKSTPAGTPEYIDTGALYGLTQELGLPLGEGNAFYTEACRRR